MPAKRKPAPAVTPALDEFDVFEDYAVKALKKWLRKIMALKEMRKRVPNFDAKNYTVDLSICDAKKMAKN